MNLNKLVQDTINSPCTKVCKINHDNICLGCFRTLEEISKWSIINAAEKAVINSSVAQRKKLLKTKT